MTFETSENLRQLDDAKWFARVGVHDEVSSVAVVLSSWEQAIAHSSSDDWKNLKLEIANRFRERLIEAKPERFCRWNDIVAEVKKCTMPLVRRKLEPAVVRYKLPRSVVETAEWDILHLCMESEYIDVLPPGFYSGLAYWYAQGHFPCGWERQHAKGLPIIY
jgi:hypothetical protein